MDFVIEALLSLIFLVTMVRVFGIGKELREMNDSAKLQALKNSQKQNECDIHLKLDDFMKVKDSTKLFSHNHQSIMNELSEIKKLLKIP